MTKPRGRPLTYTAEVADVICNRLANGESLYGICKAKDMPPESTVRGWVVDDHAGFAAKYARSRDVGLDHVAERVIAIADGKGDSQRDRLRFDARRWYLSKLAPKRYGDKKEVEHSGGVTVVSQGHDDSL